MRKKLLTDFLPQISFTWLHSGLLVGLFVSSIWEVGVSSSEIHRYANSACNILYMGMDWNLRSLEKPLDRLRSTP